MKISGAIGEQTDEFFSMAEPIAINAPNKSVISREDAARSANKSIKTIDRLIRSGNLETVSLGRRVFIVPQSLEKYIGRPLQPIPADESMMIIPCSVYDQMKEKIHCAEAKVAQLANAEKNLTELKDRYDIVVQKYERLQKSMSSQPWYQKLLSGNLWKSRKCHSKNALSLDWGIRS